MINFQKYGFHFSTGSKTGILFLLILLLLLIIFRAILPLVANTPTNADEQQLALAWKQYLHENRMGLIATAVTDSIHAPKTSSHEIHNFNPNTVSEEALRAFGLSARTVRTWIHYREKGGRFFKVEDLQKLYTLSPEDYQRIKPYAQFSSEKSENTGWSKTSDKIKTHYPIQRIPINKADTHLLKSLPGVGSVLAKRIIAFRDALGGFFEVVQLKEVYHLPDSVYQKIAGRIIIDASLIKKTNLNTAGFQEIHRHPYLRPYAKQIFQLRKKLGKFTDVGQIEQISLINAQNYRKIAPYLTI